MREAENGNIPGGAASVNAAGAVSLRNQSNDVVEIDLIDLMYEFLGHWWQVLLCVIAGAVLAFSVSAFFMTPMYRASSRIYIAAAADKRNIRMDDLRVGESLATDYKELILVRPLLNDVIEALGLDMDYEKIVRMIKVETDKNRLLTIVVTSPIPQQAANIANELAEQACFFLPGILETERPHLVEEAVIPTRKSSPKTMRNTLLGAVLGFMAAGAVITLRYLMNDTIATPDDVTKYLGVQPLAVVPEVDFDDVSRGKKKTARTNAGAESR